MRLLERSEFAGVPQPEFIAECVVRAVSKHDEKARGALRGVIGFYRDWPNRKKFVEFLQKVTAR